MKTQEDTTIAAMRDIQAAERLTDLHSVSADYGLSIEFVLTVAEEFLGRNLS